MTGDSLMRISLRTVGRLLVNGVLTQTQAAALVRWAWRKASFELLPAGATSSEEARRNDSWAASNDHFCVVCQVHRADFAGGRCPGCRDDEKRGAA